MQIQTRKLGREAVWGRLLLVQVCIQSNHGEISLLLLCGMVIFAASELTILAGAKIVFWNAQLRRFAGVKSSSVRAAKPGAAAPVLPASRAHASDTCVPDKADK